MNMKLFAGTFFLIFLAELGDKTQLAAMARSATGNGGKWTVFWAASAALIFSTLLAVMLGGTIRRLAPEPVIKTAAGVLFVLFGVMMLAEAARKREPTPAPIVAPGVLSRTVLQAAAAFEEAAWADYAKLADQAADPRLKMLLAELAEEERRHMDRIRSAEFDHGMAEWGTIGALPAASALAHDAAEGEQAAVIEHIMEHEAATAAFYEELARGAPLRVLKGVFAALAEEERGHLQRLQRFALRRDAGADHAPQAAS